MGMVRLGRAVNAKFRVFRHYWGNGEPEQVLVRGGTGSGLALGRPWPPESPGRTMHLRARVEEKGRYVRDGKGRWEWTTGQMMPSHV